MTTISDERLAEMQLRVAKIVRRYADDVPPVKQFLHDGEDRLLVDYVSALRAQGGVRVKPLEWSQGWGERRAATHFGEYRLSTNTTGHFDWHSPNGERHWASTEVGAKCAAQADYERRILSSLEASPAPVSEEMVVSIATLFGNYIPGHGWTGFGPTPEQIEAALAAKGGQ